MDITINILNHIERDCTEYASSIRSMGETPKVYTDTTYYMRKRDDYRYTGLNDNFFSIFKNNTKTDRTIILHDDLEFNKNTFRNIRHILKFAPDNPLCFFVPTNKFYKEAYNKGYNVISSYNKAWFPCVAWNRSFIIDFLSWFDNNCISYGKYAEDDWLMKYMCAMEKPVLNIIPSLVQHEGFDRSLHKNPAVCSGNPRTSFCFEEFDATTVDWKDAFSNAYTDKAKSFNMNGLKENYDKA